MGRGGKVSCRQNFKKRVRSKTKGSDDSDEDYVISDEENGASDDDFEDYCSLDGEASEESFGSYVEEEEEGEEDYVRKVPRPKAKMGSSNKRKIGRKTSQKRRRVAYEDDEEDFNDDDYGDDEDDEDEEFTLDGDESLEEEDELTTTRKKKNITKIGKRRRSRKGSARRPKTRKKPRKKPRVSKKPLGKKVEKNHGLRRKARSIDDEEDDDDFMDEKPVVRQKKNLGSRRKRRSGAISDSDILSSGSSDYEFTISEEEREQIREASEICRSFSTTLRNSSSSKASYSKGIKEDRNFCQQRKPPVRKGKEKVVDVKTEAGKQVCGICLSEEDRRRVRGTLNCCSHYFCFTCIMEWSKVESRCPLCKQRFKTISKPARSNTGIDLRDVVITVPKRDQVYQPSEEELRGYIDPYENVICTECHQGGDDGLMLLCDICDSPAHTYCVGLGYEVPEGNWYCDGCQPAALGSSSSQAQDLPSDQRTTNNNVSNGPSPREALDLNSPPLPHTPFSHGLGNATSPRFPAGDAPAVSPASGAGAATLSRRRWIHSQIQNLLSLNRMDFIAGRTDASSAANSTRDIPNSQTDRVRESAVQHTTRQEMGTWYNNFPEGLHDTPSVPLQSQEQWSLGHVRRQADQDQSTATTDRSANKTFLDGIGDLNSSVCGPFHQESIRSSIGSDGSMSPRAVREESHFYAAKEQLQSLVKGHLKSLSRDIDLGYSTFKDISRSSTHTILAACGLEHRRNEVYPVPVRSTCPHTGGLANGQTSLMKGCCSSCFDSFVRDVVKTILNSRLPSWLVGARS